MNDSLTKTEIQAFQELVNEQDVPEASAVEHALSTLDIHNGNLEMSFQELWLEEVGNLGPAAKGDRSLWQVALKVLRQEICGDDGLRSRLLDFNKNPGSASVLTGTIVYLVGLTTLPINPAIATVVVLYFSKVGLTIFCEYTEPAAADEAA